MILHVYAPNLEEVDIDDSAIRVSIMQSFHTGDYSSCYPGADLPGGPEGPWPPPGG